MDAQQTDRRITPALPRLGFFCKTCNLFFKLTENRPQGHKREVAGGESTIVELTIVCRACGATHIYDPAVITLEDPGEREKFGFPSAG